MTAAAIACLLITAVDGDSVYCHTGKGRELMRLIGDGTPHVNGFDTPEIRGYDCPLEFQLGRAARLRTKSLAETPGAYLEDTGERDNTQAQRRLVRLWVPVDGGYKTAGSILLDEGLAEVWTPGYRKDWCPR